MKASFLRPGGAATFRTTRRAAANGVSVGSVTRLPFLWPPCSSRLPPAGKPFVSEAARGERERKGQKSDNIVKISGGHLITYLDERRRMAGFSKRNSENTWPKFSLSFFGQRRMYVTSHAEPGSICPD